MHYAGETIKLVQYTKLMWAPQQICVTTVCYSYRHTKTTENKHLPTNFIINLKSVSTEKYSQVNK